MAKKARHFRSPASSRIRLMLGIISVLALSCIEARAGQAVSGHGDRAAEWLLLLNSPDQEQRLAAIRAAGISGDGRALAPLTRLAQAKAQDGTVRMAAITALGELRRPQAVTVLTAMLERELEERTGLWAALIPALGAARDRRAVPVLLRALNDRRDDWLGREMAARALGSVGDPAAVPALLAAAEAGDTREAAIAALARMHDARAAEVFIGALQEAESPAAFQAARDGLVALADRAVPYLSAALQEYQPEYPDTFKRLAVIDTLTRIGSEQAHAVLAHTADRDPDPAVRAAARRAIRQHTDGGIEGSHTD